MAAWAICTPCDEVIEPSCGEGVFLKAAWKRIQALSLPDTPQGESIIGFELDPAASDTARSAVAALGARVRIETADFFDVAPAPTADAVVGNPPFVRYQEFAGAARAKAQRAALAAGVRLNGLASSWAAFVIHASRFLRHDGRMALILPAELLHVRYAAPVRKYLMGRFARVTLVTFEKRVFPGVLSEIVLLLAQGTGSTTSIDLMQVEDIDGLQNGRVRRRAWTPAPEEIKWTPALVPPESLDVYRTLLDSEDFVPLSTWGTIQLGAVSGNNSYFRMSHDRAEKLALDSNDLIDVLPPGSHALHGLKYSSEVHRHLAERKAQTLLFYPDDNLTSSAARAYVAVGEQQCVHEAYKCKVRRPWWRIPLPKIADIFISYMSHDSPRLVSNTAEVHALNSVHGLCLNAETRFARELLPLAMLNSVTALGAEIIGRSYGGGVLKMEPREAADLPVPSPKAVVSLADKLVSMEASAEELLRDGMHDAVRVRVDEVVLNRRRSATTARLSQVKRARDALRSRRFSRT